MQTTRAYDDSDRLITLVENAAGSVPAKRTSHYEYTDDGWLRKLKCDNASVVPGGQQVTEWVYGVTDGGGSWLNSNRLVLKKFYPDSTGPTDYEFYGYNRQQEMSYLGDRNKTTHVLDYDKFGRLIQDGITGYGSGVDNSIFALVTFYNRRGMLSHLTTFNSAYTPLNQIYREFNDFNQLVTEYQEHSGGVNLSTTPKVRYSYANGSTNTIRPIGITYPDGTVIATGYVSAQAGFLSRPDQVLEGTTIIASMRYLGLGAEILLAYEDASDTVLTYENGGTGDAGDKYTGLDRFGRLVETIWENSGGSVKLVQSSYGRNRTGGVIWRRDDKAHSLSTPVITQDNSYAYDGLRQVTLHERGNLVSGVIDPTTRQQKEDFTYDETGNWPGYANTVPSPGTSLSQTRTHNKGNEITEIVNPSDVVQPAYDANGNMTWMPAPSDWTFLYTCKWDPWNRLVEVVEGRSTVVATFAYDASHRRTILTTPGPVARNFYYNKQWRAVEERVLGNVQAQYTWHPADRRKLIRRKRTTSGTLDETRFCLHDYLDPVATIGTSGIVQERYGYDAFGKVRVMNSGFATIPTSSTEWNWLFHGEFQDTVTLLYNYGYRYYHTSLGRWITKDPLGERASENLYLFVGNIAPNELDLLGLLAPGHETLPDCTIKIFVGHGISDPLFSDFELINPSDISKSTVPWDIDGPDSSAACVLGCNTGNYVKVKHLIPGVDQPSRNIMDGALCTLTEEAYNKAKDKASDICGSTPLLRLRENRSALLS